MQTVNNILYGGIFIKDPSLVANFIDSSYSKKIQFPHIISFTYASIGIDRLQSFLNNLTESYSIVVDKVSTTPHYIYLHVKEVITSKGVLPYYKDTKILLAKKSPATKEKLVWKDITPITLEAYSKLIFKSNKNEKVSNSSSVDNK